MQCVLVILLVACFAALLPSSFAFGGNNNKRATALQPETTEGLEDTADAPTENAISGTNSADDVPSESDLDDAVAMQKKIIERTEAAGNVAKETLDALEGVREEAKAVDSAKKETAETAHTITQAEKENKQQQEKVEELKHEEAKAAAVSQTAGKKLGGGEKPHGGSSRPVAETVLMGIVTFIVYRSTMQ